MTWDSVLILQPAELDGGGSRGGLDKFVALAARLHVVPLLWGNQNIQFAPLHLDDFVECVFRLIGSDAKGVKIVELCGPERLNGATLALRLDRKSTRLNSSHSQISYAVFCLKEKIDIHP